MTKIFCLFMLLLVPQCWAEQPIWEGTDHQQLCEDLKYMGPPPSDRPRPQELAILQECDDFQLYFGFDKQPDFVAARKCAFLKQSQPDSVWSGTPILMMLYANGKGVPRNLNVALHLACHHQASASAEYEGRISHLKQLRDSQSAGHFDYCDDITSGMMMGYCSLKDDAFQQIESNKRLQKITATWTVSYRQAFDVLQQVKQRYFDAHIDEVDQSGSARVAIVVDSLRTREDEFIETLSHLTQQKLPQASEAMFVNTDQQLNQVYQKLMQRKANEIFGSVTNANIKSAQRAWLKYRDAWLEFAKQKYPNVSEFALKNWLTRQRVELLREQWQ